MIGTLDHYYDAADQLQALDTPFMLLAQPNLGASILVLGNVGTVTQARQFVTALQEAIDQRFGSDDQSQPSSDSL